MRTVLTGEIGWVVVEYILAGPLPASPFLHVLSREPAGFQNWYAT